MAEHMSAALSRLGPTCLGKEHYARTKSKQLILCVYVVGQNILTQERNYLKTYVRTFLTCQRIPSLVYL